jgi:hypothetical protein
MQPMFSESLEFKLATNRLQHLENEMEDHVMAAHYEANACHKCEQFMHFCILAYEALSSSERTWLAADQEGVQEYTDKQYNSLKEAYERLFVLAEILKREAERFSETGYDVERLNQFRTCHDEVSDWLERNKWQDDARALLDERFAQEEADEVASKRRDLAT